MKNLTHKSAWYSPRGFANEGTYIYGTKEEVDNFFDEHVAGDANCGWGCTMKHKSERTAIERCEREARQDINRHRRCAEIAAIGVASVEEMVDGRY